MRKVYLAHSISTKGEYEDSERVANLIRDLGYEVYAAAENNEINDKSNEPTPWDIYDADITQQVMSADIIVANISGGSQDGTIAEIGAAAGYNEAADETKMIIGYTSNARLQIPQFHKGIPSAGANHIVLGAIATWGFFAGNEEDMLLELSNMNRGNHNG